jgi:hypothetical protein
MAGNSLVYRSMRSMCATPDFGDQLFDMLTPVDLSALLSAFDMVISNTQSKKYMQLWRQFFTDNRWMLQMISLGFEVSFVGNDIVTIMNWTRNPTLMDGKRRQLYLDLRLVSPVASRAYALTSNENLDHVIKEQKHMERFMEHNAFTETLESGIYARYSSLSASKELPDHWTVHSAWLDLTITSSIKHGVYKDELRHMQAKTNHNMSTALWYGEKSMQKWYVPDRATRGRLCIDTGVMLRIENASSMRMPINIRLGRFWCISRVLNRNSATGAYLFQQERLFDCTEMFRARDECLIV